MNTTATQSFRSRVLGVAVIAAFPLAIACSVVTGTALVDRYQASATYLAPLPRPQSGSCPDCLTVGLGAGLRTPPTITRVPSVKTPLDRPAAPRGGSS